MPPTITDRDIVFTCQACAGELVVDREGAGMSLPCPHCGSALIIPGVTALSDATLSDSPQPLTPAEASSSAPLPPAPSRQFDFSDQTIEQVQRRQSELKHQLKENRSQDTEMRGHVNRATMELHRLQLRLKKLQERQTDIEAELGAIDRHLPSQTNA